MSLLNFDIPENYRLYISIDTSTSSLQETERGSKRSVALQSRDAVSNTLLWIFEHSFWRRTVPVSQILHFSGTFEHFRELLVPNFLTFKHCSPRESSTVADFALFWYFRTLPGTSSARSPDFWTLPSQRIQHRLRFRVFRALLNTSRNHSAQISQSLNTSFPESPALPQSQILQFFAGSLEHLPLIVWTSILFYTPPFLLRINMTTSTTAESPPARNNITGRCSASPVFGAVVFPDVDVFCDALASLVSMLWTSFVSVKMNFISFANRYPSGTALRLSYSRL